MSEPHKLLDIPLNALNDNETVTAGYQAPAVKKAFQLLKVVAASRKELGLSELAQRLGFSKSTTHGLIRALLQAGALDQSPKQKKFGEAKLVNLPQYCRECSVRDMCNGGCPKNRFIFTPEDEPGLNYLCSGYRRFFNYCKPFVSQVASIWKQNK